MYALLASPALCFGDAEVDEFEDVADTLQQDLASAQQAPFPASGAAETEAKIVRRSEHSLHLFCI
jgi:hypothetical protein